MSSDRPRAPQLPPSGLAEEILAQLGATVAPGQDQILRFADAVSGIEQPAPQLPEELHLVVFRLDAEEFGVPIERLTEIVRVPAITRVPEAPEHVRGVISIRGRILPLVEIRTRLGLTPATPDTRSRVLLVNAHGRTLGVLVDSVSCVERIPRAALVAPPAEVLSAHVNYVTSVAQLGQRLIILIDIDQALLLRPVSEGQ